MLKIAKCKYIHKRNVSNVEQLRSQQGLYLGTTMESQRLEKIMNKKLIILDVIKLNHVPDILLKRLQEIIMYLICKHSVIINYANVCRVSINDKLTPKAEQLKNPLCVTVRDFRALCTKPYRACAVT